jgi:predicted lysophospholipase L1 biosynthesis ABC-type transport system permease subunit
MLRRLIAFGICILLAFSVFASAESLSQRYEDAVSQLNAADYAGAAASFHANSKTACSSTSTHPLCKC